MRDVRDGGLLERDQIRLQTPFGPYDGDLDGDDDSDGETDGDGSE